MILQMFAIRRKADGYYLPNLPRGHRGGHTFSAPCDPKPYQSPRLFATEHGAKSALSHWCRGELHRKVEQSSWDGNPEETLTIKPGTARNKEDMEIVPVMLCLPGGRVSP